MKVDAHQHFFDPRIMNYPWITPALEKINSPFLPDDLKEIIGELGIEKTVLVQATGSLEETLWLLELSKKNNFIGAVVGWVDLEDEQVGEVLDDLMEQYPKLRGIRHQVEDEKDNNWLIRPGVLRGLNELAKRDLSYDLLVRVDQLCVFDQIVEACPNLQLILDHIAKPAMRESEFDKKWAEVIKKAASHKDLLCKISGMITEADHENWTIDDLRPYVYFIIENFGFDRLVFGSDWPVCTLAGTYEQVWNVINDLLKEKGISSDDWDKIFGLNAQKFYKI